LLEKQFKRYFKIASQKKGVVGENFILLLECRLDNIVYRFGWAESRAEARQIVGHGHIKVNGKGVNIPSFQVKPGDVISVKEKKNNVERIKKIMKLTEGRGIPEWLERDSEGVTGRILRLPKREEIELPINEDLIVAFYSK
jgi:small subunit ribosomal protein S4